MATKKNMLGAASRSSTQSKSARYAANAKKVEKKKTTAAAGPTYTGKPVSVSPVQKSTYAPKPTNIGVVPLPTFSDTKTPTRRRRRVGKKRNMLG